MAHCIMFPPRHIIESIFRTLNRLERNITHSVWICYQSTDQFITSFLPLATIYLLLIISSHLWCLAFRLLHWTKFYYIFVSHGRPLWEILKDPGGESNKHPCMGIPIREIIRREHELEHQSKCCEKKLRDLDVSFRNRWDDSRTIIVKRTIHIWKTSLLIFGGFPTLDRVIFSWYANVLFTCSILYYLGQIISCRLGFICAPELTNQCMLKRSSLRRKRGRHACHGRVKNLRSRKQRKWSRKNLLRRLSDVSTTSDAASAFTTVLNIDQRSRKMGGSGMFSFDSDSTTIVCDNSANVSICNTKSMYVGEMQHIHNTNVATIGGKGHPASGIGTVKWCWKDDKGIAHEFLVEGVL